MLAAAVLAAAGCAAPALPGLAAASSPAAPVLVAPNVELSCPERGAQLDTEVEPSLAADPRNPSRLLATWQQDRFAAGAARAVVVAASGDGGRTWRGSPLPRQTVCTGGDWAAASDPVAAFDAGGGAHALALLVGDPQRRSAVVVSSSRDLASWTDPVVIDAVARPALDDKPALAADPAIPGRLFAAWSRYADASHDSGGGRLMVSRSDDGGASWTPAAVVYGDGTTEVSSASLVVLSGGRLVLVFTEGSPDFDPEHPGLVAVRVARSADGGRTWSSAGVLATYTLGLVRLASGSQIRATNQLVAAAGSGARVYVSWFEIGEPAALRMARSDDAGLTWLALPPVASGAAAGYLPALAAGGGSVALLRYRLTTVPGLKAAAEAVLAVSGDRGQTWRERRLGQPFDLTRAPVAGPGAFLGDYQGLAAVGGGFGALFAVSPPYARTGASDLYFARG